MSLFFGNPPNPVDEIESALEILGCEGLLDMMSFNHFPVADLFEQGADFLGSQWGDSSPAGHTLFF
jgi:hypothetical protein